MYKLEEKMATFNQGCKLLATSRTKDGKNFFKTKKEFTETNLTDIPEQVLL
jgi:hypothetical protein